MVVVGVGVYCYVVEENKGWGLLQTVWSVCVLGTVLWAWDLWVATWVPYCSRVEEEVVSDCHSALAAASGGRARSVHGVPGTGSWNSVLEGCVRRLNTAWANRGVGPGTKVQGSLLQHGPGTWLSNPDSIETCQFSHCFSYPWEF